MTTEDYVKKHKTSTYKKGDKLVMHNCYEASFPENKGKVWTCLTDSFEDRDKDDLVFLEGYSGSFYCKYTMKIDI